MSATVAYVDHAEQVGGAEKSLVELIAHLDRARFDPAILHVPDAQWLRYAENLRVRLRPALPRSTLYATRRDELSGGPGEALWRLGEALRPMRALYREFGALRPALVHTNSTKMHLLAGVAARARRRPVVWHMRDRLTEPGALAWLRRAVRMVRPHVIAISEAVAAQFEGMPCPVRVIPNGIPLERFEPGPPPPGSARGAGLPDGAPVVCVVARLTPLEGHQMLLRAWPAVCARVPEARLLVVGEVRSGRRATATTARAGRGAGRVDSDAVWLGVRGRRRSAAPERPTGAALHRRALRAGAHRSDGGGPTGRPTASGGSARDRGGRRDGSAGASATPGRWPTRLPSC